MQSEKWTGTAGLSRERWGLWKDSVEAVHSSTASKETKKIVRTAVWAMEGADGTKLT